MKKILLSGIIALLIILSGKSTAAQNSDSLLWLVSTYGGTNGFGAIATTDMKGNNYTVRHSFTAAEGKYPHGYLFMASNGLFYGTARKGGASDKGTLYSFDTATYVVTRLHSFNGTSNGGEPQSSLVEAPNGKLYGTAWNGGASGVGTLFELDITQNTPVFTKKIDFNVVNGEYPTNTLFLMCDGRIFGMTPTGGPSGGGYGTIFGYDYTSNTLEKLYQFDNLTGRNPYGGFILASDGLLYGLAAAGGNDGNGNNTDYGTIFSFNPADSTFNLEFSFGNTTGRTPRSDLLEASNGKLYGMTQLGGAGDDGVIFEFDPVTDSYSKLLEFFYQGTREPSSAFFESTNGKLYATTQWGGTGGAGVAFEFDPASSTFTKKVDFNWTNGGLPQYAKFVHPASLSGLCDVSCEAFQVNLTDSNGDPLPGGSLEYREGGGNPWQAATELTDGIFCIDTERSQVGLRMTYGPQIVKVGGVPTDNEYTFQTVNVTVALEEGGSPVDGGEVDYTAYGFHPFGTTGDDGIGSGTVSQEMLPAQYTFRMQYLGEKENKTEVISTINNLITFDVDDLKSSAVGEEDIRVVAYPNPFNSSTTIAFSLKQTEKISIAIYDIDGRIIEMLYDDRMQPGNHKLSWDSYGIQKGIYFVRFMSNEKVFTTRIIKM